MAYNYNNNNNNPQAQNFWDFIQNMQAANYPGHEAPAADAPRGPPPAEGSFDPFYQSFFRPCPPGRGPPPFDFDPFGDHGPFGGRGPFGDPSRGRGRHGRRGRHDHHHSGSHERNPEDSEGREEHSHDDEHEHGEKDKHEHGSRSPSPHGPGPRGRPTHGHGPNGHYGPRGPHPHHHGGRGGWGSWGGRGGGRRCGGGDRRHRQGPGGPPPPFDGQPFDVSGLLASLSSHPLAQALRPYAEANGLGHLFTPANPASEGVDAARSSPDTVVADEGVDTFTPPIDIFSTSEGWILHVALPGAKKEDVGVNWDVEKSELNVAGVVYRGGDEEFLKGMVSGERRVGVFERAVGLPPAAEAREKKDEVEIDGDNITAKLEDGVLVVMVPKIEKEKEWTEVKKVDIE